MASDVLTTAGNDIRENLVTTAVKFLQNPNVQRCTIESKQRFLRSKGLSDPEIAKAMEKCVELLDVPSLTSELMVFQSRRSWFKDHIVPLLLYGGFAFGCYWFYKNCIRQLLFVEEPKRKSTSECIDELRKSLDMLNTNVTSLRTEMSATAQQSAMRSQLDNIKSDIASVKGILLNRNQFPLPKTRNDPPCIPSWQRQSVEATSTEPPAEEKKKTHRTRSQRSESGGSNSSEGEQATKNSDSSLEIMQRSVSGGSNSSEGEHATKNSDSSLEIMENVKMTKPRHPMSAYMIFLNENKERMKAENPDLKVTELAKKGEDLWRSMDSLARSEWDEKARKAKEQYQKEMELYRQYVGEELCKEDLSE